MKKTLLTVAVALVMTIMNVNAQNVNIPDANFKAYLVGNTAINTNADTEIQVSEATTFTGTISLNTLNIIDLTGIEEFTSLTQLQVFYEPITSIDISQNTALTILYLYNNALTSLDVSNNTALVELRFDRNPIMNINVSTLPNLEWLVCGNSGLTSLDVTNNPNLGFLDIGGNPVYGNVNQITALNLANNTQLYHLGTWGTPIAALDLTNNLGLETLDCPSNNLTILDVSMLPSLEYLNCNSNSITSLDVSNNLALTNLYFGSNPIIGSIDVSNHTSLEAIDCNNTQISALNIANGNNSNFTGMWAYDNPNLTCIQVDDATWSTANWNAWTNIDPTASYREDCSCIVTIPDANFKAYLVGNSAINTNSDTEIQCSEANSFTGDILCSGLSISDLAGVEQFTSLNGINCASNTISDLTPLPFSITWVNCASNIGITDVNLSAYSNLTWFRGNDCNLTNLNVANGNNTSLYSFYAQNNSNLTCIEVDNAAYSTTNWTNIDATTSFSEDCSLLSVTDISIENHFSVYPNPVKDIINFSVQTNVKLLSITGQIITEKKNVTTLDLSAQTTGIYFLTLTDNNGQVIQQSKIIKE